MGTLAIKPRFKRATRWATGIIERTSGYERYGAVKKIIQALGITKLSSR